MMLNHLETNIRWDGALLTGWNDSCVIHGRRPNIWHRRDLTEIFEKSWLEECNDRGLKFTSAMIFWRPAWSHNHEAHVDILDHGQELLLAAGAFNAIIGGIGSRMRWFGMPPVMESDLRFTKANTPYLSWPTDQLVKESDAELGGPHISLVRVDIPHAISVAQEPRWCISLRVANIRDFSCWESMVDHYLGLGIFHPAIPNQST